MVGIRPGEKIHEELINTAEIKDTISGKKHYVVLSNFTQNQLLNYCKNNYIKVSKNFSYNSGTNSHFMSLADLKKIVKAFSKK